MDAVLENLLRTGIRSLLRPGPAVAYGLLARTWQGITGLVSVLLIAHFFSPTTQGFYYTFVSLLALQVFVELGLYLVIVNTATHEWALLYMDDQGRIAGDPRAKSRLISLGHFIIRWYSVATVIFVTGCGAAGYWFLSLSESHEVSWRLPWAAAAILMGGVLCTTPFLSLLEGCNQVKAVNRFRFWQAVAGTTVLWVTIISGGGLWATAAMSFIALASVLYFLLIRYRPFFRAFWHDSVTARINWREEIWPMQWRIGVQGLVNYFIYSFFTPLIFHYHGAQTAGRVGMTLQFVNGLQALAFVWIQARIPQFGAFIARKQFGDLNSEWQRATLTSTLFIVAGAALFLALIYVLNSLKFAFAERLLDPFATSLFMSGLVFAHITQCQAAYLRAHKREVLMMTGVISGLAMGFAAWWLGKRYSTTGIAVAYFIVMTFVAFPLASHAWARARKEWHKVNVAAGNVI